ncbi:molybdenum cofactor biosynthesis protein 1 B [Drechmeria coniospora]|uniref:Molybdenum cofactor biosynthesis protein 1 n=1 Tax=Drechmeria coniospora TaxID=98403 RepID=A0A151GMG6_DRECN|nr:molybdenum cofactor biosynthesis protein 1 B [Drechmeria coniospora]KYK58305.1 molybdenum cofactor biosynthesis protein 1 B [Drechmeria coniospora]ODA82858.1 hypothetical protein RJ55_01367 [Drechmeria coniospora]
MHPAPCSLLVAAPRSARGFQQLAGHLSLRLRPRRRLLGSAAAVQAHDHGDLAEAAAPIKTGRGVRIRDAKPFSEFLTDTFHRSHDYLRISVTERCNLRCVYCMPEEGVPLSPSKELLTTAEIVLLSSLFVSQGVSKIRLTGGEPTVRADIVPLMHRLGALRSQGLRELCITTNGISLHRKLDSMVDAGLTGVNLSLDTLDPWQFQIMTRRKGLDAVRKSIDKILELNRLGAGIKLKINCVVMRGVNDGEIMSFVDMTREKDMEIRFIEYMPFDGNKWSRAKMVSYAEILDVIREKYPTLGKVRDDKNDTSKTWHIPGFAGRIGFITSMTHNFCGTCNRLRITSDGNLKVCLFGNTEVSLRDILRKSNHGEPVDEEAFETLRRISSSRQHGSAPNEVELLDAIGTAVKGKKAKHAGLGELEHMKNRPMILIDDGPRFLPPIVPARVRQILGSTALLPSMPRSRVHSCKGRQMFSTSRRRGQTKSRDSASREAAREGLGLTHVSASGSARMVSISEKSITSRVATAACTVRFSSDVAPKLIEDDQMKKGDVLGVARVAGIMAAKRTADLIPLCHPIAISHVKLGLHVRPAAAEGGEGWPTVEIRATVTCDGKTGVEMEALTAAATAALTVYDMCKAVDKEMRIEGLRVVLKDGGKSGRWETE